MLFIYYTCSSTYDVKDWKLAPSTTWPPQLKKLRLDGFEFTHNSFMSTIRQLKCVESIDLAECSIAGSDKSEFKDIAILSQYITEVIDDEDRHQRLDVVMPERMKWKENRKVRQLSCLVDVCMLILLL